MKLNVEVRSKQWRVECTDKSDFWNNVNLGRWEPDTYEAIDLLLGPESTFVDAGAWIGPLALFAARICRRVVAYECDPVALRELERNIAINPDISGKIELNRFALSDEDRAVDLHSRQMGNSETTIFSDVERDGSVVRLFRSIEVEARDARRSLAEVVETLTGDDVVKMDVEGSEYEIINRIKHSVSRSQCNWIVSLHESNIIRSGEAAGAVRAAADIMLIDCFDNYHCYNLNFEELGRAEIYESMLRMEWEGDQTLIFSRRKLQPIHPDGMRRRRRRAASMLTSSAARSRRVPGTLADGNGGSGRAGAGLAAWTSFQPSVAAGIGHIRSYSGHGRFNRVGRTVTFTAMVEIEDHGDAAQAVAFRLPIGSPAGFSTVHGAEDQKLGKALMGVIYPGVDTVDVKCCDNTYPGVSGSRLIFSGTYEVRLPPDPPEEGDDPPRPTPAHVGMESGKGVAGAGSAPESAASRPRSRPNPL